MAIAAHSKADEDKLSNDARPSRRRRSRRCACSLDTETGQLVLWCLGEAHADVVLDRLSSKYGVAVDQQDLRVALRETFSAPASGHGTPRQAERRPRAVRDLPHRGRAAAVRSRLRVRRQGGRRRGAAPVHPERREGCARPARTRCAGGLPGRRHPRHAARRQGPLGRLLRHGLPDRRRAGAAGRGAGRDGLAARAGARGRASWWTTNTSARSCRTCRPSAAG